MKYIAITQETADWLLGKPRLVDALHEVLTSDRSVLVVLKQSVLVQDPLRLAASANNEILAVWNRDYLSGTGEESWGFLLREGQGGLLREPGITREVFERMVYICNQRLQMLHIDGSYIHRAWPNGAHTCLAGRGTRARQSSVGYFDCSSDQGTSERRGVICVGPMHDYEAVVRVAEQEGKNIKALLSEVNALFVSASNRVSIDPDAFSELGHALQAYSSTRPVSDYDNLEVKTETHSICDVAARLSSGMTFLEWMEPRSPLSDVQRRILTSDAIERHPLRIIGPGGSGKTLLMQLLLLRCLKRAKDERAPTKILYIVHNTAMAHNVKQKLRILDNGLGLLDDTASKCRITTLAEYGIGELGIEDGAVIDPDAYEAKLFQFREVRESLQRTIDANPEKVAGSSLFTAVAENSELFETLAVLIMTEISHAIKGHGLELDRRRYVQSEKRLTRLHGLLALEERELVFDTFEDYHNSVFEGYEVLDSDDVALSLLGKLRTPIWQLKRRKLGFDYVFVDETQLFNENERRVFPLLCNDRKSHVPIVLALDEAQNIYSISTAGIATLGIPDIANESLAAIHRSTRAIIRLAFFVIQRTTDLFGPDFPDFTSLANQMEEDGHHLAAHPLVERATKDSKNLGRFVLKRVRELRKANLRRIAVICHADQYWDTLFDELKKSDLPLQVLLKRGERLEGSDPLVVITRPLFCGGQEFDAVILAGLEQGLVPPRVIDNEALSSAVEQQSLREIYLAVTRARYRIVVALSERGSLTSVLQDAVDQGFLRHSGKGG